MFDNFSESEQKS